MDFNPDCMIEGCERESVDASGYCKKHKPQPPAADEARKRYDFKANLTQEIVVLKKEIEGADKTIVQLAEELAAERTKTDNLCKWYQEQLEELKRKDEVHWKTRRTLLRELAAERENVRIEEQSYEIATLQEQLAAELEKVEATDAANCSLLALAAVVKGHPDTPQSLKDLASKELLDHGRGSYLINEVRTLRRELAAERKKFDALASTQFDLEQNAMQWCAKAKELEEKLAAEQEKVKVERRCRKLEAQAMKGDKR